MSRNRSTLKKKDSRSRGLFAWFTSRDKQSVSKEGTFLPAEIFEVQLNQERARADRSGSPFVVLTFAVELGETYGSLVEGAERLLADTLSDELRMCDTEGWHANGVTSVAAILPNTTEFDSYTPMRRAEKLFRDRFKNAFPNVDETPQLRCGVHAYPNEGSWGRRGTLDVDKPVKPVTLKRDVFVESEPVVAASNGNGRHA